MIADEAVPITLWVPWLRPHLSLPFVVALAGCAAASNPAPTAAPEEAAGGPDVDRFEYVAGEDEVQEVAPDADVFGEADKAPAVTGDFALTSAEKVHEVAEAAVEGQLNPKQTWRASPVLPSQWPTKETRVRVLFYPMAAHPDSTSLYELFTAGYSVQVSLTDGSTNVAKIKKRRRLGTIEVKRASMLERNEVAIAEQALVEAVLGRETPVGENNYWGYLKYFREHPKLARDIKTRAPAFVRWLNRKS